MVEAAQNPNIPGYRIERLLARGGMASVYLATQKTLNRRVALKVLTKRETREFTERFQNESRLVASLNHANVITIHDLDVVEGSYFIAMEYLEGGDLKARIAEGLDPETVLEIIEHVADCLQFVHERGIVHRDIKPANILFRSDGMPVLTDFGIAKHTQGDAEAALTETGTTLGTPYYMSPEQARGEPLDGRADIYSLGIVFYEALTGKKPYRGTTNVDTMLKHVQEPIPRLPAHLAHLQGILDHMLAKHPGERFANAAELHEAVRIARSATSGTYSTARITAATAGLSTHAGRGPTTLDGWNHRVGPVLLALAISGLVIGGLATWLWTDVTVHLPSDFGPSATQTLPSATQPPESNASDPSLVTGGLAATGKTAPGPAEAAAGEDDSPAEDQDAALDAPPAGAAANAAGSPGSASPIEQQDPTREQIRENLEKAAVAVDELRLTTPAGNNAWFYYQQVLALDPDNLIAIRGINRLADVYAILVEKHWQRGNQRRARQFLSRGLSIKGDHAELLALEQVVRAAPRRQDNAEVLEVEKETPADFNLIDNIRDFFKRGEVVSPVDEHDDY